MGNVIALCPNHHSLADDGVLEREYLSEIVRLRVSNDAEVNAEPTDGTPSTEECGDRPPEESGESHGGCTTDAADGDEDGCACE